MIQCLARSYEYNSKDLEEKLEEGWTVSLCTTWEDTAGKTKMIEYILSKENKDEINDDLDKYIL